jgi:hypothetical protein
VLSARKRSTCPFLASRSFEINHIIPYLKGHCHVKVRRKSIKGDGLGLKYEPLNGFKIFDRPFNSCLNNLPFLYKWKFYP